MGRGRPDRVAISLIGFLHAPEVRQRKQGGPIEEEGKKGRSEEKKLLNEESLPFCPVRRPSREEEGVLHFPMEPSPDLPGKQEG